MKVRRVFSSSIDREEFKPLHEKQQAKFAAIALLRNQAVKLGFQGIELVDAHLLIEYNYVLRTDCNWFNSVERYFCDIVYARREVLLK